MASINGIQVKGLKSFSGHDGEPLAQGNVYYKGKKLGFWSQDAWGGEDNYDFNESVVDAEVAKFRESDAVEDEYREFADLASLLEDLVNFMQTEKEYKKGIKMGYPTYVEATDGYHVCGYYTRQTDKDAIKETAYYEKFMSNFRKTAFKNKKVKVSIFNCKEDFDIVY